MKLSKYTNIVKANQAYLLHNSLYNSMIKVNDDRLKKVIDSIEDKKSFEYDSSDDFLQSLNELKMIVDEGVNETNIANYFAYMRSKSELQIIMIVTRNCNFRCPYCYQEHLKNKSMTAGLMEQIRIAILKKIQEGDFKNVEIAWFGGEPTLELEKVITFMQLLRKEMPANVELIGQMTTNGYLLNIENLRRLVNVGVIRYQITVDGLAHTHNTTRIMEESTPTWDVIIRNLEEAKKSDLQFSFAIRTNFTASIVESSYEWFRFLKERFSDDIRFNFYFEAVKKLGDLRSYILDYSEEEARDASSYLIDVAKEVGLDFNSFYRRISPFGMRCYAANPNSYAIDYDGTIKKCTVSLERPKNHVGKVDNGEFIIDEANFSWWTNYDTERKCKDCSIYPSCFGEKCPNSYPKQASCDTNIKLFMDTLKMFI